MLYPAALQRDQAGVQRFDLLHHSDLGKATPCAGAARGTHVRSKGFVFQETLDSIRKSKWVSGWHQEASSSMLDEFS